MKLFSRKLKPKPDTYSYTFPENVRNRILLAFKHLAQTANDQSGLLFDTLVEDVGDKLLREYGSLVQPRDTAAWARTHPVVPHFFLCSDAQVIDFILTAFRSLHYRADQRGVDEINRILREEAIGYEFTDYITRRVQKPDHVTPWGQGRICTFVETNYPEVIEKREEYTHVTIVKPCLAALANPIFKVANGEMLKAHEHVRKNNLNEAITCCGSAYESVMKTILDKKGWRYDTKKDTCGPLVDICVQKNLLPSYYAEAFKTPGRIRNELSSAHGRGPVPVRTPDPKHVDHMIQLSSANILLLVKLAGF